MTKLKQLIDELCPNGVEVLNLENCCNILDKKRKPITKSAREAGEYPYYGANGIQDYVSDYIFDGTFILVGEDGSVLTPEGTPVVNWAEGKIWVNNHAHIVEQTDGVLLRYLFHYLQTIDVRDLIHGNIPKLTQGDFRQLKIAVPPLPVQSEIVRILDSFTELTAELTAKLTAELTARTKQYEYYRECILDKNDHVEWVPLLDVADTYTGLTYKPTDTAPQGTIVLRSSNIKDRQLVFEDNVYVNLDSIPARAIVQENDILICVRNGSKALIGKAAIIPKHDKKMAFGAFMTILRAKKLVIPRYLFYVWQSPRVQNMIHGDSAMAINQITKKMLEQILVPVPSLAEQENIVAVLDRFDKLNNGIVEGLPAEIEARQKQYEYYRDKLLTFKERVD